MEPVLQVALDHMHLKRALLAAKEAVEGGADWLEAGTPLVKSEGMESYKGAISVLTESALCGQTQHDYRWLRDFWIVWNLADVVHSFCRPSLLSCSERRATPPGATRR